jgi:hypothetical protein
MADGDPATHFGRAGLTYGTYSPVMTQLAPPIQLPQTGQLWAEAGKNALAASQQVFDTLMKSPLNPEVKAKMDEGRLAAEHGIKTLNWLKDQPFGYATTGIDASGNAYIIPAAQAGPTIAAQALTGAIKKTTGATTPAAHDPDNPNDSQSKEPTTTAAQPAGVGAPPGKFMNPATGSFEPLVIPAPAAPAPPAQQAKPVDPSTLTGPPKLPASTQVTQQPSNLYAATGQPPPPSPAAFQGPSQAETNAAIQESLARNQFASAEQGVPAGYQPPTQYPTVAQDQTTPGQPPAQDQQALQAWQAQNAHPVASAQDALTWAKTFHTGYTDATYLPHAGPGGEPAFNFTGKNGASNLVPISQMVKNGFAPRVAAQSTSAVLGVADQARQQPPAQPQQAAPVAPAQPPTQYPTVAQDQTVPGQPPAAPGMTDIYGNPLSAYTNVPSRGGPAASQVTAGEGAGQPTQPGGQPEEHPLIAPAPKELDQDQVRKEVTALTPSQLKDAKSGRGEESGDPYAGSSGGFDWYQDKGSGRLYTFMPDPNKWREQRFYLGSNGWQGGFQLNSTATNETMENLFTNGNAAFPKYFSHYDIANMKPDMKKYWIEQNSYFKNSKPDANVTTMLQNNAEAIRRVEMLKDIVNAADKYGNEIGAQAKGSDEYYKYWRAWADNPEKETTEIGRDKAAIGRAMLKFGGSEHPMALDLQGQINELGRNLSVPGMEPVANRETPATSGVNLSGAVWGVGQASLSWGAHPASNDPLDIPAIKYLTQPGTKEERLRYLNQTGEELKRYYQANVDRANLNQVRVPQEDVENIAELRQNKPLQFDEKYNDYRRNGQVVNPHSRNTEAAPTPTPTPTPTPAATPAPLPVIRNDTEMAAFKKKYPDPKTRPHFQAPDASGNLIEYQ